MAEGECAVADETLFYSSRHSQAGKAWRWLWVGGAIALVGLLAGQKGGAGIFSLLVFAAIFGALLLYQRSTLRPGQPLVTLHDDCIESPLFRGRQKRIAWPDVAAVDLKADHQARRLELQLAECAGRPDKRNFWNGINDARPSIPLNVFDEMTQERLLDAVRRRIGAASADGGPANELAVEREFQAQLKALAPVPWLTGMLIAANVGVWLLTLALGAGFATAGADKLLVWGGNAASEVQRGEWWRLVSATFMHSGVMHLLMNMIGLYTAGVTVERIYGRRLFALIYFGAGLSGSALSLHFAAQHAVSVGASGAVFGVTGALLVAVYQHRDKLPRAFSKQTLSGLSFFIVYALIQGFAKQGIDNAAHVGGLLGGCLLAFILPERFDPAHFAATARRRAIAGLAVVLVATVGIAATAPRASLDQMGRLRSQAAFTRAMGNFDAAMRQLTQEQAAVKAGQISERDSDERSRSVYAPLFRAVLKDWQAVALADSDPRRPLLQDLRRMTELLVESLAMESVYRAGSAKPEPADPARMAEIEREVGAIGTRLQRLADEKK